MKLKAMVAAASMLVAGSVMASPVFLPSQDFGQLGKPNPTQFFDLTFASSAVLNDYFTFSLGSTSDLFGSVATFGVASISNLKIDGVGPTSLVGGDFSFTGLTAGVHKLSLTATTGAPLSGYTGSVYATAAVPEPESLALALAGLGIVGGVAMRRRQSIGR